MQKLLSTGEFAKLCRTTKETLFHYDREGLLKPKSVSGNSYRYYGPEQFFEFDLISVLKQTGTPLKQIKELTGTLDGGRLLDLLEEKRLFIQKEKDRLTQREDLLHDMIRCTRESLSLEFDVFGIQEQDEEELEQMPTPLSPLELTADFAERFAEYVDSYEKEGRIPRYPYGVLVAQSDCIKGQYLERYFFSRATRYTPDAQRHIKPAGRYAVLAHRGTVQTHLEAFANMIAQIEHAGMRIIGNAYVYDMMSVFLIRNAAEHSSKYCIRVA